jgi:hypothetical protein
MGYPITSFDKDGNQLVTAVSGTLKVRVMDPGDADLTGSDAATILYSSATGCKAWWVEPIGALGTAVLLAAGSTTEADGAAVAALLNLASGVDGKIDSPDGAPISGVTVISPQSKEYLKQTWDGTNKIKTIGIRASQAAFTGKALLYTVE